MPQATPKHVIFLGAGASKGSGYPLANELRLLLSSPSHLKEALKHCRRVDHAGADRVWMDVEACLRRNAKALELFRNGGFATIDEFCKLAGGRFASEIHGLRRLVRAVLGTVCPEDNFEKSEYYSFVQALFKEDLCTLRDDITVITFNYDSYLDFLLHRALHRRCEIGGETEPREHSLNSVTSGFHNPQNRDWIADGGFCLLKLHGSICYPNEPNRGFTELFTGPKEGLALNLFAHEGNVVTPPIMFPWECVPMAGNKASYCALIGSSAQHEECLPGLLKAIWAKARFAVGEAEKISFVGLSMHPFLNDGFKYLFHGRSGEAEIVIANPENILVDPNRRETHWAAIPGSPSKQLLTMLKHCAAPDFKIKGRPPGKSVKTGEITLHKDFASFIRYEMKFVP